MNTEYTNIYNNLIKLTRNKNLYLNLKNKDTFSDRLIILLFHFFFYLKNYKNKMPKKNAQDLFDFFIRQIELSIREIGYGDVSVNKKMKDYVNLFFSILEKIEIWENLNQSDKLKLMCNYMNIKEDILRGMWEPLVMVTFFQVFPADRRGFAMGIYGMSMTMALAFGPVVGGITIDALSWRYIFFVPLPLITIALVLGLVFMPSVRRKERPKFDWAGYLLICITLFCLVSALSNGQKLGWLSDHISGLLAITVVGAVAFLWSQSKAQDPLLDLSLFRNPAFASACMIAFIFGMGNFATTYAVPVFGQLVQGMSATDAGMLMMPAGLIVAFALPFTGRLADRSKPHYIIICGLFFFFLGTALLGGADANTPYWHVAFFGMVSRFGMSFIMPSVMSTALKSGPRGGLPNSLMSAPAMKVPPSQRSTIALTPSSASAASKLSFRPWRTCHESAFTGGLLTMTTATSPSFCSVTLTGVSSDMGDSS